MTESTTIPFRLGTYSHYTIGTANATESLEFYRDLGFIEYGQGQHPNPHYMISDGGILILLNEEGDQYLALNYYAGDMEGRVAELEKRGVDIVHRVEHEGNLAMAVISSPDGTMIGLTNMEPEDRFEPEAPTLVDLTPEQWKDPDAFPNPHIGVFGELAWPVEDLEASLDWWQKAGFEIGSKNEEPYPWAVVYDGLNLIGLHQKDTMGRPALTYFAPDQAERIADLVDKGMSPEGYDGQSPDKGNAVLPTPEGQRFYLFKL